MRRILPFGCTLLLFAAAASAYLFQPTLVPDALTRANAWIKDHPTRSEGYYFLARINGSAWAKGITGDAAKVSIATFGDADRAPFFVPWDSLMYNRDPKLQITAESKKYLLASIAAYRQAVDLDAKNPIYQLGLAWALDQAGAAHLQPPPKPGDAPLTPAEQQQCQNALALLADADSTKRDQASQTLAALLSRDAEMLLAVKSTDLEVTTRIAGIIESYWLTEAADHYRQVYDRSIAQDLKAPQYDAEADATVSVKAGERLLAILPTQPSTPPEEIKKIEQALLVIKTKPQLLHAY